MFSRVRFCPASLPLTYIDESPCFETKTPGENCRARTISTEPAMRGIEISCFGLMDIFPYRSASVTTRLSPVTVICSTSTDMATLSGCCACAVCDTANSRTDANIEAKSFLNFGLVVDENESSVFTTADSFSDYRLIAVSQPIRCIDSSVPRLHQSSCRMQPR